jgi:hypothetical protein
MKAEIIIWVIALTIGLFVIVALGKAKSDCEQKGGIYYRGMPFYECSK